MRIVNELPPKRIYDACVKQFGVSFDDGIVWTYGDAIHTKYPLRPDVCAHEKVHIKQQLAMGVVKWWDQYLEDPQFRYEQELEAYQAQWKFIKKNVQSRNDQFNFLKHIARDLSGPMYGNMVTFQQAITKIKNG